MVENMWPLPLRVKSDVYLGMKFDESTALNGRFQYKSTSEQQAVAASTYRPNLSDNNQTEATDVSNVFSSDGAEGYILENEDGILRDMNGIEDVVQSFLKREVLDPSRSSGLEQLMISINVVGVDQFSMVKITDTASASSNTRRHLLRGVASKDATSSLIQSSFAKSHLRVRRSNHHRNLIMPRPHNVLHLHVYGTYSSRASSDVASIIQTINGFGKVIEHAINTKNVELISDIRKRTGFNGPECIGSSSNKTDADLSSYSTIDLGGSGSDSSETLFCNELLPLYYYDLSELESRGETNNNAILDDTVKLSTALDALKKESETYDVSSAQVETDSGNSFMVYVALR